MSRLPADQLRNDAAIANAHLLGDLKERPHGWVHSSPRSVEYRFEGQGVVGRDADTIEHAAWLFLAKLGYGIDRHGYITKQFRDNPARSQAT